MFLDRFLDDIQKCVIIFWCFYMRLPRRLLSREDIDPGFKAVRASIPKTRGSRTKVTAVTSASKTFEVYRSGRGMYTVVYHDPYLQTMSDLGIQRAVTRDPIGVMRNFMNRSNIRNGAANVIDEVYGRKKKRMYDLDRTKTNSIRQKVLKYLRASHLAPFRRGGVPIHLTEAVFKNYRIFK